MSYDSAEEFERRGEGHGGTMTATQASFSAEATIRLAARNPEGEVTCRVTIHLPAAARVSAVGETMVALAHLGYEFETGVEGVRA